MGLSSGQVDDMTYGVGSQLLRVGTTHLDQPARTPSPLPSHRRQRLSAALPNPWPNSGRRLGGNGQGGGRRLPPTPNKPSTLNIDSLTNVAAISSGLHPSKEATENHTTNRLSINFPKLNLSPSRGSLLTNLKNRTLGNAVNSTGPLNGVGGSGARLPDLPDQANKLGNHRRQLPRRGGRWSRSLDDPETLEEVIRAGRGIELHFVSRVTRFFFINIFLEI